MSADGWDRPEVALPVSAKGGRLSLDGVVGDGQSTTLTLDPDLRYGTLQAFVSGGRSLLVATSNAAPVLWTILAVTVGCVIWRPPQTAVTLIGLCTFAYVMTMIDRVLIFRQGLAYRAVVISDARRRSRSPTRSCPATPSWCRPTTNRKWSVNSWPR